MPALDPQNGILLITRAGASGSLVCPAVLREMFYREGLSLPASTLASTSQPSKKRNASLMAPAALNVQSLLPAQEVEKRQAKKARRRTGLSAQPAPAENQTRLELASVSAACRSRYQRLWEGVEDRRVYPVSAAGGVVPGRVRLGERSIPDCSSDLLQSLATVAGDAPSEASSARLAKTCSTSSPSSDPVRGGGTHGPDGFWRRAGFDRAILAPGLCAVSSALGGSKAAQEGRDQASAETRHRELLAVCPQPSRRGRAFQDSRVRRDNATGPEVPSRAGRRHPPMPRAGSKDFSARKQGDQRLHAPGAGASEPSALGAPTLVPTPPWGGQLRLQ